MNKETKNKEEFAITIIIENQNKKRTIAYAIIPMVIYEYNRNGMNRANEETRVE